jgi:amino acid adenylation domain-containing protein
MTTGRASTLTELFERTARRHPDQPAVSDDERSISYQQLGNRARALAAELRRHGIGEQDRVAVHLPRGVDAVVAVLGVLYAGAAYLPVDVRYPDDRRDYMLRDGAVRAVVTPPGWTGRLARLEALVVEWRSEERHDGLAIADWAADDDHATPAGAACVLYTSGSTGQPKGIVLEHRNLLCFATNSALPELTPGDRTGQVASISFDPFNYDLWCSFAGGAEIVTLPTIPELLATDFGRELRRRRISNMLMPAVAINHLAMTDRDALSSLRVLHSGGDVLLPEACRSILAGSFRGRLFNLYGPAETTTACTGYEVRELATDEDSVPIGAALDGFELYVLDEQLRPVPDGEVGELHIGGPAVARGYLGRPELTAQRFLTDPFAPAGPGGVQPRMYASGDQVMRRPDGVLLYRGRRDSQVKIHGYRVEPGEVERLLCRHPEVHEAAVIAVGEAGARRLVGLLVADESIVLRELRSWLLDTAPEYLVPAELIVLRALPVDPHGKRDWAALAAIAEDHARRLSGYREPGDDIERFLATLWEDLLAVERVGAEDDFFALGGHSLLAVRARLEIEAQLGVALESERLFQSSRLCELADLVRATAAASGDRPAPDEYAGQRSSR